MGEEEEEEFELGICNMFVCRPCPERHPWSLRLEQPWQRRCVVEPASRAGTSKRRRTGQRESTADEKQERDCKINGIGNHDQAEGRGRWRGESRQTETMARAREGASWSGAARAAAARRDVGTVIAEVRRRGSQSREISRRLPCTCRGKVCRRQGMERREEAGQSVRARLDTD